MWKIIVASALLAHSSLATAHDAFVPHLPLANELLHLLTHALPVVVLGLAGYWLLRTLNGKQKSLIKLPITRNRRP